MQEQALEFITKRRAFMVSVLVAAVCWSLYYAWYLAGFPGHRIHVFAELDTGGLFRQKANGISNFAFVIFGLIIAWDAGTRRYKPTSHSENRMLRSDYYSGIYALAMILLGFGSLAMHGALTSFGGFLDVSSMFIWVAYCVAYPLARIVRRGPVFFLVTYAALSTVLVVLLSQGMLPGSETFGGLITLSVLWECVYRFKNRKQVRFDNKWVFFTALSFFTAFGIWNLSLDNRPFYNPNTLFQGHAAWHILCAVAAWTIYKYYCSERSVEES